MAVPKSVTKLSKDGVTYKSSVEWVEYTLTELTRGALRDVGKFIMKAYRTKFYQLHPKQSGEVGKGASYWVRKKETDLQVGLGKKGRGFWGMFYEIGTSKTPKEDILRSVVYENIDQIIEIESQYLSELSKEEPNMSGLSEEDYDEE